MNWESGGEGQSGGDKDLEQMVAILLGLGLAAYFGPQFAPEIARQAGAWLIEHHLLVPDSAALFSIPYTGAGLDLGRVISAAAITIALIALAHRTRAHRRKEARP